MSEKSTGLPEHITMEAYCDMTDREAQQYIKSLKNAIVELKESVSKNKNPVTISMLKDRMGMLTQYKANKYRSRTFKFITVPSSLRKASRSTKPVKQDDNDKARSEEDTKG